MKKYEYKFIEVERQSHKGATFKACQSIILVEAEKGWRLKQVVTNLDLCTEELSRTKMLSDAKEGAS